MTTFSTLDRRVKPTRRPFGEGILLPVGETRPAPTADDLAWWAQHSPTRGDGYTVVRSAEWDRRAAWAYAMGVLELGLIPSDVAEGIMATSLVGHDS